MPITNAFLFARLQKAVEIAIVWVGIGLAALVVLVLMPAESLALAVSCLWADFRCAKQIPNPAPAPLPVREG